MRVKVEVQVKLMVGVRGEDGARYGRYGQLWSWCGGVEILFVKFVVYGAGA